MIDITPESIFYVALELAPAERAAFLDEVCAHDAALRARIEKMLAAQPALGHFLTVHTRPAGEPLPPDALQSERLVGATIAGRYKLLQHIGEGGMGSVWMADQSEPVKRRVAVKLINDEHARSREVLARFEAERQAIALMDHPHIAKLLDAGTTGASDAPALGPGRPYFVMELVKGVALNDFCDRHQLPIPARLRLFVQICSAVQHAHQKGVIHRDLKPSNILVESHDGRPVPRVIDFGLAKAVGGTQLTDDPLVTRLGSVAGTPLYMAPEQATFNALDVDTRADVYALGVILYELLTGTTPIEHEQLKKRPFDEMLRLIRESDAPTPSQRLSSADSKPGVAANRRTEPQKLGRFVRGELDWIVMKALAKERDRRYESAAGFAGDVERFLNHEPVLAGPPGSAYRLRKFARRNRPQVVAGALLAAALLTGIAGTSFGLIRAEHRRGDAERARGDEAEQRGIAEGKEANAVAAAAAEKTAREQEADQRKKAEREWDRAEGLLYASQLELALGAWREKKDLLAWRHLGSTRPERRGWEYDVVDTRFKHRGQRTLYGHAQGVTGACFSPDGKRLASSSGDRTVRVWDAATGRHVLTLEGHTKDVNSVAFSPDGKRLASSSDDRTVRLWDATTGRHVLTLEGHGKGVNSVAFSADGKRLASGGSDDTVRVWDAATGKHALTLDGHENGVRGVCFSPDGKRLASADSESVRVWDADSGNLLHALPGHTGGINCVCFSPDGKRLASGSGNPLSHDGEVKVWDADTGKHVQTLDKSQHYWARSVCFSPDGKRLATGSLNDTVRVCDATTGVGMLTLMGHREGVTAVHFSPDGKHVASSGFDRTVKVWDAVAGQEVRTLWNPAGAVRAVHLSPDGKRLVVASDDGPVRVWDTAAGRELFALGKDTAGTPCAAFSPDGKRIVTGSALGDEEGDGLAVKVWDAATGKGLLTFPGSLDGLECVAFSPDGARVAGGSDKTARVWDAATGAELLTLDGHTGRLTSVAFSPDGTRLVTGSKDKTARTWDATSGRELLTLKEHPFSVTGVAFSPDGRRVASASGTLFYAGDGEAYVWDAATGRKVLTLKGHTGSVEGVAFSPDGTRIVTGSADETAKVWDAANGREVFTLRGHGGGVGGVCFSSAGLLATAGSEGSVKLWDAGKGPGGPLP